MANVARPGQSALPGWNCELHPHKCGMGQGQLSVLWIQTATSYGMFMRGLYLQTSVMTIIPGTMKIVLSIPSFTGPLGSLRSTMVPVRRNDPRKKLTVWQKWLAAVHCGMDLVAKLPFHCLFSLFIIIKINY